MGNWSSLFVGQLVNIQDPKERGELLQYAISRGVTPEVMTGQAKAVFARIVNYSNTAKFGIGSVPDVQTVADWFPAFDLADHVSNYPEETIQRILEDYSRRQMETFMAAYRLKQQHDPISAMQEFYANVDHLMLKQADTGNEEFTEATVDSIIEELQYRAEHHGVTGLPFPWEPFSQGTGGMEKGDLIIFYAIPKSMKTWVSLYVAVHLAMLGCRILIFSKEMTWKKMAMRIACILTKTDYGMARSGLLPKAYVENMRVVLKAFTKMGGGIRFTKAIKLSGERGGVSELKRQVESWLPHILLVDSAYQLNEDTKETQHWRVLNIISTRLKELAEDCQIPVIGVFQENEKYALEHSGKGRGTASIAGSTAIIQDVDLAVNVYLSHKHNELSLSIPASRETTFAGGSIHAHPAEDLSWAGDHIHTLGEDRKVKKNETAIANEKILAALADHGSKIMTKGDPSF